MSNLSSPSETEGSKFASTDSEAALEKLNPTLLGQNLTPINFQCSITTSKSQTSTAKVN